MINDVPLIIYIISVLVGVVSGVYASWGVERYYDEKTVFSKKFIKRIVEGIPYMYLCIFFNIFLNLALTYKYGEILNGDGTLNIVSLITYIKYITIVPLLIITFIVDLKYEVIPNRVSTILMQLGIIFVVALGLINIMLAKEMLFGMLWAILIYAGIALIGKLVTGEESMGAGDIKFMVPIGLLFGKTALFNITLAAFILCAVISLVVLVIRNMMKKKDKFIPFGPFLVIAIILVLLLPNQNYILTLFSSAIYATVKRLNS